MTSITFHGGVKEIGGNKFLVKDRNTKIFMDFGMSFSEEGKYFSEFMKARSSNYLIDMMELGLLPKIKGLYRRDYARHMGFDGNEETDIDGVLLTHAHVDHCAYIKYLREDIPIYCSEESKLIMQNFDETGVGEQYITMKDKFQIHQSKKGGMVATKGKSRPREIKVFDSNKEFSVGDIKVTALPVDHSISGVHGFILETSNGMIGNTADIRFHGRRKADSEKFVEECSKASLDLLLCEGTRIAKDPGITEYEIEDKVKKIAEETKNLVVCGYPIRDLDRLQSFYLAAKAAGRFLAIDLKQAYLLKLFSESSKLNGMYPSPTDKVIKIYIPKGKWGLLDKDINHFTQKLYNEDYKTWMREFLDYDNAIDYRDVKKSQADIMLSLSDFKLQELIDIKADGGSTYIRSLTEPFNDEMEIQQDRLKNWFIKFGLLSGNDSWHHVHVSGHGDGEQIKHVIDGANAKKLIPIHTDPKNEVRHKELHTNVQTVNQHESVNV